jgi:hypothetical protein
MQNFLNTVVLMTLYLLNDILFQSDFKLRHTPNQELHIAVAGQKIDKALTFNEQQIVGLCKLLTLNAVNFQKVGNGQRLTALKHFFTMSIYHKYDV